MRAMRRCENTNDSIRGEARESHMHIGLRLTCQHASTLIREGSALVRLPDAIYDE